LPDGPGGFTQDSSCPALLRMPLGFMELPVPDCHRLWCMFPSASGRPNLAVSRSYNPGEALPQPRFGLFPVRSPLLGESFFIFSSCGY
jgi:hypothetical protein